MNISELLKAIGLEPDHRVILIPEEYQPNAMDEIVLAIGDVAVMHDVPSEEAHIVIKAKNCVRRYVINLTNDQFISVQGYISDREFRRGISAIKPFIESLKEQS